jgi:hypothetical protein
MYVVAVEVKRLDAVGQFRRYAVVFDEVLEVVKLHPEPETTAILGSCPVKHERMQIKNP